MSAINDYLKSPGSVLFAKDQFDNGPVIFKTATHTSCNDLTRKQVVRDKNECELK